MPKLSIVQRTFLQLALAIVLIFFVLALVYSLIFSAGFRNEQERQLSITAEVLAERLAGAWDTEHIQLVSASARGDIMYAARSNDAMIWLINSRGELIMSSAFPLFSREKLPQGANGLPILPEELRNADELVVFRNNYHHSLPPKEHWLSVSVPMESEIGAYAGELLVHRRIHFGDLASSLSNRVMLVSLGAAFLLAIFLFSFLSHKITSPIRQLAEVASEVYRGDLSARVSLKKGQNTQFLDDREMSRGQVRDDLNLLVRTMNTLIEKLERTETERQDFMASISHDLRSPLTSIRGFIAGMLDGTLPSEDFPEYLSIVKDESDKLSRLVDALFELSLAENHEALQRSIFDLKDLLASESAALMPQLQARQISLSCECLDIGDKEGKTLVVGDEKQIRRVLQNILTNALHYTPEGGRILLSVSKLKAGKGFEISIEDSGEGLAEKDLPHVFDRFYKGNKARGSEGSGLGLYIARTILQRHGEIIEAGRSERLGGAAFRFTLSSPESAAR